MLAFSAFIKIAVPLFFMASGALLLRKEEPYGVTFVRRILRFAGILAAVSLFYYWESLGKDGNSCIRALLPDRSGKYGPYPCEHRHFLCA